MYLLNGDEAGRLDGRNFGITFTYINRIGTEHNLRGLCMCTSYLEKRFKEIKFMVQF